MPSTAVASAGLAVAFATSSAPEPLRRPTFSTLPARRVFPPAVRPKCGSAFSTRQPLPPVCGLPWQLSEVKAPTWKRPDSPEKYCFPAKLGGMVEATVTKAGDKYNVTLMVPREALDFGSNPMVHWGMYRAGTTKWMHPSEVVPAGSQKDEGTGGMRTPMHRSGANDTYMQCEFSIPQKLAPVSLAFTACMQDADGADVYLQLRSGQHCTVPVGVFEGHPAPLGASVTKTEGDRKSVNFAIASRCATAVSLIVARDRSSQGQENTCLEISLDPFVNKTGDVWHVELRDLDLSNVHYGWRLAGDDSWLGGGRYYPACVMLDPYSMYVAEMTLPDNVQAEINGSHKAFLGKLNFPERSDPPEVHSAPSVPLEAMVVQEIDVEKWTSASTVPEQHRGKLLGILDRLPELQEAGVTSLIISPLYAQLPGMGPGGKAALNYFSLDPSLSTSGSSVEAVAELKQVIKELHEAGVEVICQFDFCFTSDGNDANPKPVSFRGIDSGMYYRQNGVLNCGQVMVRKLILDILRHWAAEYRMDGFAILNAETLCQDSNSRILDAPPLVEALAHDPVLRYRKMIAYVGDTDLLPRNGERGFPHWGVWLQVNDYSAEVSRQFMFGADGMASQLATSIAGSPNLFAARLDADLPGALAAGRRPSFGINCFAPVMGGQRITDQTPSLPTAKALLMLQILSQGVPGLSVAAEEDPALYAFSLRLLKLREEYNELLCPPSLDSPRAIQWHGAEPGSTPDWDGFRSAEHGGKVVGFSVTSPTDSPTEPAEAILLVFNPHAEDVTVALPARPTTRPWVLAVDSAFPSPADCPQPPMPLKNSASYVIKGQSGIVMVA